jgi:two-component system, chemotaxis family, protein-glutamate methylesterase/glutaminase
MTQPAAVETTVSNGAPVRVMLVDDSAVVRGLIRRFVDPEPGIEIVATAGDGEAAIATLKRTADVDVIVLDIEMPVMDGLTAIPLLLEAQPGVKIVMASTLTERNADASLRAIAAGATDCVAKPSSGVGFNTADEFRHELIEMIHALGGTTAQARPSGAVLATRQMPITAPPAPIVLQTGPVTKPEALVIGSSTGGPQALTRFLSMIYTAMTLPIFITQHMPATFTALLAQHLTRDTGRNVLEASDGLPVEPNTAYLAAGNNHMLVEGPPGNAVIRLSQAPKVNFCRPSVDPMLESLIGIYGGAILTVILTGMGSDGKNSCQQVVEAGGTVFAQDEASSVVWGCRAAWRRPGCAGLFLISMPSRQRSCVSSMGPNHEHR